MRPALASGTSVSSSVQWDYARFNLGQGTPPMYHSCDLLHPEWVRGDRRSPALRGQPGLEAPRRGGEATWRTLVSASAEAGRRVSAGHQRSGHDSRISHPHVQCGTPSGHSGLAAWALSRDPRLDAWRIPETGEPGGLLKVKSESEVAQSCLTPSNPMDCSLPGSSIRGIFQEWGAIAFSHIYAQACLNN